MNQKINNYSFAELREQLINEEIETLREAGLLDPDTIAHLESFREHYKPNSRQHYDKQAKAEEYYNTEYYVERVRRQVGENLSKAVKTGNLAVVEHATGLADGNTVNVADWREYERVKDLWRQNPRVTDLTNAIFQCILLSSQIPPTGRGKTATMYWLTEVAQTVYPDINILSNNPNDPFETTPESWDGVEYWIRNTAGWKLLLIDEAAQFLQYDDQKSGKSVSKMLKLLRHNDCHLMMVGHTGRDIPADIRRQVFVADKTSKTTADLGYGVEQGSDDRMQVADTVMQLNGIPMTSVDYGGKGNPAVDIDFDDESLSSDVVESVDVAEFEGVVEQINDFTEELEDLEEEKREIARMLYNEHGYSYDAIGEIAGVSGESVRNWME